MESSTHSREEVRLLCLWNSIRNTASAYFPIFSTFPPTCYSKKSTKDFNQGQNKWDSKVSSEGKEEGVAIGSNRVLQEWMARYRDTKLPLYPPQEPTC